MIETAPTVSVITPSFNGGAHIAQTIQSVLDQDWPHLHYLVMDGGSTDQTQDVLRDFERSSNGRVSWVCQPDQGQADAINKGFARNSGEILAWLNSDDTYAPGAVRAAAEFLRDNPKVALVYGDANFIDSHGELIGPCVHVEPFDRERLSRYSDFIVQPAAFFRRSAFEAVGGLNPSLNWMLDWDLWMRLAERYEVAYLPRVLANYRWLGDSKTASGGWRRLEEIEEFFRQRGRASPAYVRLERVNAHLQDARDALRRGKVTSAAASTARAAGNLLASPRAVGSLMNPHTWRVIWTGQVLRARAARQPANGHEPPASANGKHSR
jgi:glycosyltransferase involved in cell wall biosynthesis